MPNEQVDHLDQGSRRSHTLAPPPGALVEHRSADGAGGNGVAPAVTPSPQTSGTPGVGGEVQYLWNVHGYMNEYIRFADTKAGVVIVLASGLVAGLYAANLHVPIVSTWPVAWEWLGVLSALAFLLLASGIVLAVWAIRPRLTNDQQCGFVFWESIRGFRSASEYWQALRAEGEERLAEHLAGHLYTLASVCRKKYFWVAVSIWVSLGGAAAGTAALLLKGVP